MPSREKVLLAGDTNTSKTLSLVSLAIIYPENRVCILDPDDGVSKVLEEFGLDIDDVPNLTVIPVTPDWSKLLQSYRIMKSVMGADDWMCFDMMGRFWDFAQNYYSKTVFGASPSEHLLNLRRQAQKPAFGGFDGLTDWTIIKRMHNEELVDDALLWNTFNVMATTSVTTYLPVERVPKTGIHGLVAQQFGLKIEGEKHNPYRFDTIAIMFRDETGRFLARLAKDKGRSVDLNFALDITRTNFWQKYLEYRGRVA